MNRHALDELKQHVPLLKYLQTLDWRQARPIGFGRLLGLCPLHDDHKPSLLVDPYKNLFYCYGCRRGGDVIRFAELYHQVEFPPAAAEPVAWLGSTIARNDGFVPLATTSSPQGRCLSTAAWHPHSGAHPTHADRLCARRMLACPPDAVGLPVPGFASSGFGDSRRL